MTKSMRRNLIFGALFCLAAVAFALLYHFKVIKNLTLILAVIYIAYFVGLAFIYNGLYCKKQVKNISAYLCFAAGVACVLASTGLLIYAFVAHLIVF